MSKLTVWIIEHDAMDSANAKAAIIEEIERKQSEFTFDPPKSYRGFTWPPKFEGDQQGSSLKLPDLVVLDLCDDEENLQGDKFYEELRIAEKKSTTKAFVIIWSNWRAKAEAEKFVKEKDKTDARFMPLPTKDLIVLKDAVRGCLEQIGEK